MPSNTQNNPIGVFDSGKGGLSVLRDLRRALPHEKFFYFGDSKNNPYGEKTQADLEKIVVRVARYLIVEKRAKMVVIACNTATTKCIDFLRKKYPKTIFIGTEPAIKLAFDSGFKNILMMATPGTITSERIKWLVEKNQNPHQKITLLACDGLANAIESGDDIKIDHTVKDILRDHRNIEYDAVVLGCTHYILVKSKIQHIFPSAMLIDGNAGIIKRTKTLLAEHQLISSNENSGGVEYLYSK